MFFHFVSALSISFSWGCCFFVAIGASAEASQCPLQRAPCSSRQPAPCPRAEPRRLSCHHAAGGQHGGGHKIDPGDPGSQRWSHPDHSPTSGSPPPWFLILQGGPDPIQWQHKPNHHTPFWARSAFTDQCGLMPAIEQS